MSQLLPHDLCVHPQNAAAIALIPQGPFDASCWQHGHSTTSHLIPALLTTTCICSSPGCGEVVSFSLSPKVFVNTLCTINVFVLTKLDMASFVGIQLNSLFLLVEGASRFRKG